MSSANTGAEKDTGTLRVKVFNMSATEHRSILGIVMIEGIHDTTKHDSVPSAAVAVDDDPPLSRPPSPPSLPLSLPHPFLLPPSSPAQHTISFFRPSHRSSRPKRGNPVVLTYCLHTSNEKDNFFNFFKGSQTLF